jgi:sensor histidine kinase YesM
MNMKFNRTDYYVLAIFFGISAIINIIDYSINNNDLLEYVIDIPVATATGVLGIAAFLYFLVPRFLVEKKQYVLFVLFGILTLIVFGAVEWILGKISAGQSLKSFTLLQFVLNSIYASADTIGFPLGVLLTKKFYESQRHLVQIEKQQKENELKLLRSQIDPHFLFNNLNTLDSLIDNDSEKAKEYINRLSLIYRYLIQTKDSEVMELSAEMEHAENYIFLIKTRFEDDYEFVIDSKASFENKFIPTGAIQALLENVVKHNKAKNSNPIRTKILVQDDFLTVRNRTSNFGSENESLGTGLENLKARYQLLSNKKVSVSDTGSEFIVTIPIIQLSA